MRAIGVQLLENTKNLKFILNENGILFFSTSQQHRDSKIDGLSYEDDYPRRFPENRSMTFGKQFMKFRI